MVIKHENELAKKVKDLFNNNKKKSQICLLWLKEINNVIRFLEIIFSWLIILFNLNKLLTKDIISWFYMD